MSAVASLWAASQERPNIIMIVVDDLGYSDITPYGANEIQMPNISRLANEGIRFRQFYNNGISAPTRASLITGQYQHKAGMGFFSNNLGLPAYQGFLNKESLTVAEVLRNAGYTTLMSGKWHVGEAYDQQPNQRGFDHFFGFLGGASSYYAHESNNRNGFGQFGFVKDNQPYTLPEGVHLTDAITDNAIEFLEGQKDDGKPFFLYLAFNAPHWPLQAKPADIAKYKGKYNEGWDSLRTVRYENAKERGVFPADQEITRRDSLIPEWNTLTYDEKKFWERRQEVFAAMIDHMDQSVGRILKELRKLKQDKNTLILFISDNGAQGGYGNASYARSRANASVGEPGSYEVQNAYWSQSGNSPLRDYKGRPYEGGIGAPFIAWYPKAIKRRGLVVDGIGHLIDIAPTFYDVAGAEYPKEFNGVVTNALPGKSLLPVLFGQEESVQREKPLCWERAGNQAVRLGNWKYLSIYPENEEELYDLSTDRGENHNVAAEHPEIVAQMRAIYAQWAAENDVVDYRVLRNQRSF